MKQDYIFTSESVSEGHPDKVCDLISDSVLDAYLERDPNARVACETLATKDLVLLAGECRSEDAPSKDELERIVRETIRHIGYDQPGFHWENVPVDIRLHQQSPDIAQGVDADESDESEGAGDQGIMFGYATTETKRLMPAPIYYAHKILWRLSQARHTNEIEILGPDAKTQVSIEYKDGAPKRASAIVLSTQHDEKASQEDVKQSVLPIIKEALPEEWIDSKTKFYINPTGRFVIGGPVGDCGLTGRKIIVDTYGGAAPHGGGAFSGKDPTKVDRSAAYMTRCLAKNVVAAGLAERCLIQLSYAIGVAEPVSFFIDTFDTGKCPEKDIAKALQELVRLTPRGIRDYLDLAKPFYKTTANYGHFGRDPQPDESFSWEKTELVEQLQSLI